mmetsp:Transcript_123533/g.275839  ORF Transcript_123533/g.275839 Transcript_123533/m.275839 type:complete len:677 (+) Transcript_123533:130-2160(+)
MALMLGPGSGPGQAPGFVPLPSPRTSVRYIKAPGGVSNVGHPALVGGISGQNFFVGQPQPPSGHPAGASPSGHTGFRVPPIAGLAGLAAATSSAVTPVCSTRGEILTTARVLTPGPPEGLGLHVAATATGPVGSFTPTPIKTSASASRLSPAPMPVVPMQSVRSHASLIVAASPTSPPSGSPRTVQVVQAIPSCAQAAPSVQTTAQLRAPLGELNVAPIHVQRAGKLVDDEAPGVAPVSRTVTPRLLPSTITSVQVVAATPVVAATKAPLSPKPPSRAPSQPVSPRIMSRMPSHASAWPVPGGTDSPRVCGSIVATSGAGTPVAVPPAPDLEAAFSPGGHDVDALQAMIETVLRAGARLRRPHEEVEALAIRLEDHGFVSREALALLDERTAREMQVPLRFVRALQEELRESDLTLAGSVPPSRDQSSHAGGAFDDDGEALKLSGGGIDGARPAATQAARPQDAESTAASGASPMPRSSSCVAPFEFQKTECVAIEKHLQRLQRARDQKHRDHALRISSTHWEQWDDPWRGTSHSVRCQRTVIPMAGMTKAKECAASSPTIAAPARPRPSGQASPGRCAKSPQTPRRPSPGPKVGAGGASPARNAKNSRLLAGTVLSRTRGSLHRTPSQVAVGPRGDADFQSPIPGEAASVAAAAAAAAAPPGQSGKRRRLTKKGA